MKSSTNAQLMPGHEGSDLLKVAKRSSTTFYHEDKYQKSPCEDFLPPNRQMEDTKSSTPLG